MTREQWAEGLEWHEGPPPHPEDPIYGSLRPPRFRFRVGMAYRLGDGSVFLYGDGLDVSWADCDQPEREDVVAWAELFEDVS